MGDESSKFELVFGLTCLSGPLSLLEIRRLDVPVDAPKAEKYCFLRFEGRDTNFLHFVEATDGYSTRVFREGKLTIYKSTGGAEWQPVESDTIYHLHVFDTMSKEQRKRVQQALDKRDEGSGVISFKK